MLKGFLAILVFVGLTAGSVPTGDCGMLAGGMGDCNMCQPAPATQVAGGVGGGSCCPVTPAEPGDENDENPTPTNNDTHRCCCATVMVFLQTAGTIQNDIVRAVQTADVSDLPFVVIDCPSPPPRV